MPIVTMRQLLEAGIHFGHQTRRWNPKMERYIFGQRNRIYIIDLQKTLRQINKAYVAVRDAVAAGGTVLFVGTKKQAREAVMREAQACGMFYVNNRWLGGTLTNWQTVRNSIQKLLELEEMDTSGKIEQYAKKEIIRLRKQCARLNKNLAGIKNMPGLPNILFVIDVKKENIAVSEAQRLGIPCIGVVDTNCDPETVSIPIPGNDDALRAVALFCSIIGNAVMDGRMLGDKVRADDEAADEPPEKSRKAKVVPDTKETEPAEAPEQKKTLDSPQESAEEAQQEE